MAIELISLESLLIILIAGVIGIGFTFVILWLTLRDKFVFALKQRFFPKGGKIHIEYWHRDGTKTEDIQSAQKVNADGIFWPSDKEKKYRVHYVPNNQRDSLGLPIAIAVEGLNYTPDLRERNELFKVQAKNEEGLLLVDEHNNPIMVEEWKHVAGAGFTTKKASELSHSNYVSAVAFGRATVLKKLEEKSKELQYTYILSIITVIILVVIGALLFMHDTKFMEFVNTINNYRGFVDGLIAGAGSSLSAS